MPPSERGEDLNLRAALRVIGNNEAVFNGPVTARGNVEMASATIAGRELVAPDRIEALEHQIGVSGWRSKLAKSRSGGAGALSALILMLGDSRARSGVTKYRYGYPDLLRRRFLGSTPAGGYGVLPASEGSFNGVLDADWPGGDNPWTYTGSIGTQVTFGIGYHAVSVPAAGSATLTYFGDKVTLLYVRTAAGPTAAVVTLDGTSVGPLNARGTQLPGQAAAYGTNGDFGFHTITVTPNDGALVLEGAQWYDNETPFFLVGTVQMVDASHGGFGAKDWNAGNVEWSAMLTGSDSFMGMGLTVLGANDIGAGRTPAQFRDDLVSIVRQVDTRLGTTTLSWLFCWLPGSQTTPTLPYVQAMRDAAAIVGVARASVFDMAALRPGRLFGSTLSADESHPNDAGHIWIAEQLGSVLDPTPTSVAPTMPKRLVIDATTPTDSRLAWTAAITQIAGTIHAYDEAGASAVRERRHRIWLEAGVPTQAVLSAYHETGRGTIEVLIGRWVGNTPTLTSCGTVDTSTPAGPAITTTVLGTTVTSDVTGWHPVVIRKTNAANLGRFVQLVLNRQG